MKALHEVNWRFYIELDNQYGFYWSSEADNFGGSGLGGFICSSRHFKTAEGCLKNLNKFARINNLKRIEIGGDLENVLTNKRGSK